MATDKYDEIAHRIAKSRGYHHDDGFVDIIAEALREVARESSTPPPGCVRTPEGKDVPIGPPRAWSVVAPPGEEFDEYIFPDKDNAELRAEVFNDDLPEGQSLYFPVPLYAIETPEAAEAARSGQ